MELQNVLQLDEDESQHQQQLDDASKANLRFANDAAILALNGITSATDSVAFNEPLGLTSLLLAKCASNVRFAVIGLQMGYYAGVDAVLRSAFEALAFGVLFRSQPGQVARWFRNQFAQREGIEKDRAELLAHAKTTLLQGEEHRRIISEETKNFWEVANQHVHATLPGLAQQFGLSLEDLIPSDFHDVFLQGHEDFENALESYVLLKCGPGRQRRASRMRRTPTEMTYVHLSNRYDQTMCVDLSLFAFYVAHRLLDFTKDIFTISDREFLTGFRAWHREMRRRHD